MESIDFRLVRHNSRLIKLVRALQASNQRLKHLSTTDALTALENRRGFEEAIEMEWARAQRERTSLAVVLADVDYFKRYNDACGHPAGDLCLQEVAGALRDVLQRPADRVARLGGEEFVLLLPDTDLQGADDVAERARRAVERLQRWHPRSTAASCVTISLGAAATIPLPMQMPSTLLHEADVALYAAKSAGRNRVHAFSPLPPVQQPQRRIEEEQDLWMFIPETRMTRAF
jgi:diguanylate cyclase (GGDEF)-like protein